MKFQGYEVLQPEDTRVIHHLMVEAYKLVSENAKLMGNWASNGSPREVVCRPYCGGMSGLLAKMALEKGYFAAREIHQGHVITGFTPPNPQPTDEDVIACMTWAQFVHDREKQDQVIDKMGLDPAFPGYVGLRGAAAGLFESPITHYAGFSADTLSSYQTAYMVTDQPPLQTRWVSHGVQDMAAAHVLVGEINADTFRSLERQNWAGLAAAGGISLE